MKVIVATKETQGTRRNDFFFAEEGEIVMLGSECDGEKVDGSCGCRRAMSGVRSNKATTTMIVAESDLDEAGLKDIIRRSLTESGWISLCPPKEADELVNSQYEAIHKIASTFPTGTIIERRGTYFVPRKYLPKTLVEKKLDSPAR